MTKADTKPGETPLDDGGPTFGQWQPIKTAPKDGRDLLVCVAGCKVAVIAQWVRTPRGGKWIAGDPDDFESMDAWADYVGNHDFPATHWMPLPPPPADAMLLARKATGGDGDV